MTSLPTTGRLYYRGRLAGLTGSAVESVPVATGSPAGRTVKCRLLDTRSVLFIAQVNVVRAVIHTSRLLHVHSFI